MKFYTVESYKEKEAPFKIAWRVELFENYILLEKYEHIFCHEIAGYCKCLEDMGFIRIATPDLPDEEAVKTVRDAIQNGEIDLFSIYNNDKKAIENAKKSWYERIGCWPDDTPTLY